MEVPHFCKYGRAVAGLSYWRKHSHLRHRGCSYPTAIACLLARSVVYSLLAGPTNPGTAPSAERDIFSYPEFLRFADVTKSLVRLGLFSGPFRAEMRSFNPEAPIERINRAYVRERPSTSWAFVPSLALSFPKRAGPCSANQRPGCHQLRLLGSSLSARSESCGTKDPDR